LFKQRTLIVLCAAVTLANSVGYIAASASSDPLAGLAAGVFTFGGTIGFFHEHTD
jgi:small-conductance mechanosensitive channel